MAFDFPSPATNGQVYTSGGVTYQYNGYAWIITGGGGGGSVSGDYVLKTGDVMSGFLTLNAAPTAAMHAAPKSYVDSRATPPGGLDGQALVSQTGVATWGAPIDGGTL
jgi:hypothetical protein